MPEETFSVAITLGTASFEASGQVEFVMQALDVFKSMASSPLPSETEEVPGAAGDGAAPTAPQQSAASKVPLPQFLASDAIKGNAKIAAAIVAWAADHENKAALTAPDIKRYWRNTNVKIPANINRDVDGAQKHGWLSKDHNSYSITGFGRTAIGLS